MADFDFQEPDNRKYAKMNSTHGAMGSGTFLRQATTKYPKVGGRTNEAALKKKKTSGNRSYYEDTRY